MSHFEIFNDQGVKVLSDESPPHSLYSVEGVITTASANPYYNVNFYYDGWKRLSGFKEQKDLRLFAPNPSPVFSKYSLGRAAYSPLEDTQVAWSCAPDNVLLSGALYPYASPNDFQNHSTYPSRILYTSSDNTALNTSPRYLQTYDEDGNLIFNLSDKTLVGNLQYVWTLSANEINKSNFKSFTKLYSYGYNEYYLFKEVKITSSDGTPLYVTNPSGILSAPQYGAPFFGIVFDWNVNGTELTIKLVGTVDVRNNIYPSFVADVGPVQFNHSFPVVSFPNVII